MAELRLETRLADLRVTERPRLAPYLTAGDGGLTRTRALLAAADAANVGCIELGVPFSDPIADGPVLQAAAQRALDSGTGLAGILATVADWRADGGSAPLVLFSYANPILWGLPDRRDGLAATLERVAAAGVDGLLIPDLPVEESAAWRAACAANGLALVHFVAPTTSDARVRAAAEASRGFLYAIGRTGVTGAKTDLEQGARAFLERVRALTTLPLAVGFGIRTAAQVAALAPCTDLIVVGSALVEHAHRAAAASPDPDRAAAEAARSYLAELTEGIPR